MNDTDPLQQLRDIHLPPDIGWWPLAPGWWLLLALFLGLLAAALWWSVQRWRQGAYRRAGRQELRECHERWQADGDHSQFLQSVNNILKRAALASFPWNNVASLSGDRWVNFLDDHATGAGIGFSGGPLDSALYSGRVDSSGLEQCYQAALAWLSHHRSQPC
jgi:hypothetical protein